ncbi:MAG: trigger factor [Pseudomonadota bacterium]|nr:trigger factor [Pseudomonadota bacterium]
MTMQVTETSAEGLKREFTVTVPAEEITDSANERLKELSKSVNLPGFRPGKVPTSVLRQRYGDAVRGEVLERTIQQSWQKALEEREIRPASEPKIEIVTFEDGEDLEYKLAVELMPDIDDFDLSKVELERPVVPVSDEEIDRSLERLAANKKKYEAAEGGAAEDQDQILMDFKGTVEGKEFPGSSMEGFELVLGQGGFLPGFEEQMIGVQAGEKKQITLTMPEDFGNDDLKGKEVAFDVTVKEVRKAAQVEINDDLAKASGFEDLAALRIGIREQLEREYGQLTRASLKRALLDKLADEVKFELPKTMVDGEFDTIWKQISEAKEKGSLEESDKDKSDEELKENYQAIAERRVRLGIFLAEVGRKNNITVTQDDLNRAMHAEAARFPGQEAAVLEYFQKNDSAKNELQAPIFEDKVVDFIVELAKVTEKEVSLSDLMKLDQPDGNEKKTD